MTPGEYGERLALAVAKDEPEVIEGELIDASDPWKLHLRIKNVTPGAKQEQQNRGWATGDDTLDALYYALYGASQGDFLDWMRAEFARNGTRYHERGTNTPPRGW